MVTRTSTVFFRIKGILQKLGVVLGGFYGSFFFSGLESIRGTTTDTEISLSLSLSLSLHSVSRIYTFLTALNSERERERERERARRNQLITKEKATNSIAHNNRPLIEYYIGGLSVY